MQQRKSRQLLPAIVAVGSACGFATLPANALELGEIQVNSTLGQPLRASIAYALNPGEQLANYCIYLRPGAAANGIPVFSQAQIAVTDSAILLTGNAPVREPMLNMQVAVDCPYTPHLLREYTLMVDPASRTAPIYAARATAAPVTTTDSAATATRQAPANVAARPAPATETNATSTVTRNTAPIGPDTQYRVQPGDTVSTIVSRIEGRSLKLWPAVTAIFDANPDAFINNDVNQLMAGKLISIPAIVGVVGSTPAAEQTAATTVNLDIAPATENVALVAPATSIPALNEAATVSTANEAVAPAAGVSENLVPEVVLDVSNASPATDSITEDQATQLRPGDIVLAPLDTDTSDVTLTDTLVEDETATRVDQAGNPAAEGTNGAWNWLFWLGGTGLALILALLLFGRTLRERFGSLAIGRSQIEGRRADDDPTQRTRVIEDVDYDFEDTINSKAISLDADLEDGTGLQETLDVDVAQDFGFTTDGQAQSDVDIEVTEYAAREPEDTPTDVIPPQHRADVSTILEEEETVDEYGEDYDVSMIVDATKQTLGDDDDTAKDLQAIQIDADTVNEDNDATGSYTLTNEIDYQVLEQDYEDELTATQALNAEVARAAAELQELQDKMEQTEDVAITAEMPGVETTNEMPGVEKTQEMPGTEETREMPVSGEASESHTDSIVVPDVSNPDHTAELKANLPTSLEAENDADVDELASATTIELSAAGSDVTVEMIVESGSVDTKKDS